MNVLKRVGDFFGVHEDDVTVVSVMSILAAAILGLAFWLGYTGRYKPTPRFTERQPERLDTLSLGFVRRVEFTTASSSSMPVMAGIPVGGGGILIPIGGGTSSSVYTMVNTDSSSFMVNGSIALRIGHEAKLIKRSRGISTVILAGIDGAFSEYRFK